MGDLSHDVASKLLAIKEKKDQEAQAKNTQSAPPSEPQAAVESTKPVESVTPETTKPTGEQTETAPTTTEPTAVSEQPKDEKPAEESVEFKWDADIVDSAKEQTPQTVDFKKLGSAFELNASTEEEFVKQIAEKAAKLKELEEQTSKAFEGVPTELKEAIEIARKNGDWYSFIEHSLLDVTKLDPVDLFEQEYEKQEAHKYKNPDGSIDYDKLDEALDSVPEAIKVMQGKQIQTNLYLQQQQRKQQIVAQAERAKEAFTMQLGEAVKDLPNHFPKDTFGITLEPQHMASIYDGIASQKLIEKHLGKLDPQIIAKFDAKKLAATLAKAEWAAGISKAQYKKGITEAKRELLDKTQNAQINPPSRSAEPEQVGAKQPSPAEKLKARLAGSIPVGSL